MSVTISSKVLSGVENVCRVAVHEALSKLAESNMLECSVSDAMSMLDIQLTKAVKKGGVRRGTRVKKEKATLPLPFCGVVDESSCFGIRLNHGLHTQCQNDKDGLGDYCKTCQKHADKNANGKPSHGDIRDRLECGLLEFRDPKGRQTIPYGNVVEKLGLDKDAVIAEAEKFGLVIPEEHWQVMKKTRGRPKKSVSEVSDTDSEVSKPKKRGRPRKIKAVESAVGDDLLANMRAADSASEMSDVSSECSDAEAKAARKAAKAAEREAKKAEKARQAAELKAMKEEEREQKKAEKLAAKEAEKEAKAKARAEAKAAKEAEKEAAKAAKAAEKEAAKAAKAAEREAKKAAKAAEKKASKPTTPVVSELEEEADSPVAAMPAPSAFPESISPIAPVEEEETEEADATQFEHNGKTYLKTADNFVYTMEALEADEPEPIGLWNPETKTIDEIDLQSDDEEEDE